MTTVHKKRTKKKALKAISRTSGELCFWVHEGPVLESITDLKKTLKTMSSEQFEHHTRKRNDFSVWLTDVLHHAQCAKALARAKTQAGMTRALMSCKD